MYHKTILYNKLVASFRSANKIKSSKILNYRGGLRTDIVLKRCLIKIHKNLQTKLKNLDAPALKLAKVKKF